MEKDYSLEPVKAQMLAEVHELSECNEFSIKYGLVLSENQIQNLVQKRFETLRDTGRIEFGAGILKKLVYAFCDSPYIHNLNYEATILELQDAFYYFKNESDDRIADDELIEYMKDTFDGKAQGSIEYLTGTSLEELRRDAHHGFIDDVDDGKEDMD
ncbi:MAG: hypothetical protein CVU91_12905 [Firmicutes bacterium HGW-Firmicutes-16]|nr:MAG: hypothetical protein CVU91_12905 [Firmicutes bacterium HGW-Firmicutes-16]